MVKDRIVAYRRGNPKAGATITAEENQEDFRKEIKSRLEAIEILKEGSGALQTLAKVCSRLAKQEMRLAQLKEQEIQSTDRDSWWNMASSGWAGGGLEAFGDQLAKVLDSLNETSLANSVRGKLCFQRELPISMEDEELKPEVSPAPSEGAQYEALSSFNPTGLPYRRALGEDWVYGQYGFAVSGKTASLMSTFLKDNGIPHVFTGGATGKPKLCFKSEVDMNRALKAINSL